MLKPLLLSSLSLDTEGKAHALQNDSECGLFTSGTPDGSSKILVSYTGCYVFEWVSDLRGSAGAVATAGLAALTGVFLPQDGNYLMLVGLEGTDAAGQKVLHEEKLLRCPVDLPGKILTGPWETLFVSCGNECPSFWMAVPSQSGAEKGDLCCLEDSLEKGLDIGATNLLGTCASLARSAGECSSCLLAIF